MSRSKSKRTAPKYQRAKLACLPLLFATLGYVLLSGSDSEDETATPASASSRTASAARQFPVGTTGSEPRGRQPTKLPDWSELASARRAGCNPFLPIVKEDDEKKVPPPIASEFQPPVVQPSQAAVAASAETPEPAEPAAPTIDVATLSQQPVRYFFQTNNRRVMLVGDRLLAEGQMFDSYTVTHLEPNRIELEPPARKPWQGGE